MFDIPDEEILERNEEPCCDADDTVASLTYNQSERDLVRDGVDYIDVAPIDDPEGDAEERYRIDYTGYAFGSLVVTRAGMEAFGAFVLGDRLRVPHWLLSVADETGTPWWVPEDHESPEPVTCATCGESVSVDEVVTLGDRNEPAGYRCESCWQAER